MAANLKGLKLSESEVSQTIDLEDVFGVPLTGNQALKQSIGQAIIDKIIERTKDGVDVNGRGFAKYSKEYVESPEFKAFGKSEGNVNLTLEGNMLGTLDVLETPGSKVKIGWDDSTENAKAYNHNVGDTVKKRRFFGATEKILREVREEFAPAVEEEASKLQEEKDQIRSEILRRLGINRVEIDGEG